MSSSAEFVTPSEAARRLGVSAKALRLYEQRRLVVPVRTTSGWRMYGPEQMARAAEIARLRGLGLSLAQAGRVMAGDPADLDAALAAHQAALEGQVRELAEMTAKVRDMRADLGRGRPPAAGELATGIEPASSRRVAFDLPWPWGGERFEFEDIRALNYIIGSLGSGKTRLAMRLAETLPKAVFLGLDRLEDDGAAARARLDVDPGLKAHIDQLLTCLMDDGATVSGALTALLVGLEDEGPAVVVVDMVEQGLDEATQRALIGYLRRRGPSGRPLFLMTRSTAILDLAVVGPDEAIILCPANHSPPTQVSPYPGAPGYEAVATCLAAPAVRARTEGMIVMRSQVA